MNVIGNLRMILAVTAAAALPTTLAVRVAAVAAGVAQSARASSSDRAQFVGTYRLLRTEVKDASGKWSQTPGFNSIGYITYADTGHMGVHIMPRTRPHFAGDMPIGEEAQAALRGYTAYFGSFTVDDKEQFVVHHRVGQMNPGGATEAKRFYVFVGDRLILTPEAVDGGGKDRATRRLIWERLPDAPLSAEAKKFVGFHTLLYRDNYRLKDGKEVFHGNRDHSQAGTSYIIYTSTGHMMAHLMDKEGRTKYVGAQPTPDEALKAYDSYGGYFGRFTVYDNYSQPFVTHNQQGTTRPGGEMDFTKRFYVFTGNVLRLGAPPIPNAAGEMGGNHLYWERMPPVRR